MKRLFLFIVVLLLSACVPTDVAPSPDSDSGQAYELSARIPVDDSVYNIVGEVVADVGSITRQTQAAFGSAFAVSGFGSGVYYGPEFGGKGLIRLRVTSSDSNLAPVGEVIILKSTDMKGAALLPGDVVEFKCRHQYEAIAAVRNNSTFNSELLGTWEIDYCRLVTPVITPLEVTGE